MTKVTKWTGIEASETKQFEIEYRYCPSCSGALSARIKKDSDGDIESWLRYEYSGLELLRIDEVYDADNDGTLEDPSGGQDGWRILNLYVHSGSPLPICAKWFTYRYPNSGAYCDSGTYYYMYDAVGNVNGVIQDGNYYRWEMDAFGNDLNGGNAFFPMDSPVS